MAGDYKLFVQGSGKRVERVGFQLDDFMVMGHNLFTGIMVQLNQMFCQVRLYNSIPVFLAFI
ncbi:hypothetical protein [Sphingobium sp. 15-1]|uniref:hypothetical protein n=1 Tax=Sphingobium sp. 15-1 TaxID=2729616 RepID=UPI001C3F6C55|nr:hypothetical protein [Sphingobium sp. 15-1]